MTDYERYQLEWMIEHGHSLGELISELTSLQNDLEATPGVNLTVGDVFDAWEQDHGFGGEVFACEAEYNETEGRLAKSTSVGHSTTAHDVLGHTPSLKEEAIAMRDASDGLAAGGFGAPPDPDR